MNGGSWPDLVGRESAERCDVDDGAAQVRYAGQDSGYLKLEIFRFSSNFRDVNRTSLSFIFDMTKVIEVIKKSSKYGQLLLCFCGYCGFIFTDLFGRSWFVGHFHLKLTYYSFKF